MATPPLENAVLDYASTWTTEDPDYCGSTELEVTYGVTGWDREVGDIRYNEIPETGNGNVWMTHIWWSDRPQHPCDDGDYIYQTGWSAKAEVGPTTAPDGTSITYPTRLTNPEPDDEDWESMILILLPQLRSGRSRRAQISIRLMLMDIPRQ